MPLLLFKTDLSRVLIFPRNAGKQKHSIIHLHGKKQSLAHILYIKRLSYFWIYLHWTERGLQVFALQRPEAPGTPPLELPPIPFQGGRPA